MSERKAKLKKADKNQEYKKTKKTKFEIITNVILAVMLAAFVVLGGWALVSHYSANNVTEDSQVTDSQTTDGQDTTNENAEQKIPTLAEYCEQNSTTPEDFAKEYNLELGKDITVDTLMSDVVNKLTLTDYAKMAGMDVKTIREQLQIPEDVKDSDIMMDIFTKISSQQ